MTIKNLCITLASLTLSIVTAFAQTTAFTYQGRLIDNGARANGNYDLTFVIYDASTDGNVVGATLTNSSVVVSNGLFTTQLDFGANVFTNSPLWLEIGERVSGGGNFTTLSPRQSLTAVPYAIQAVNALTANSVSAANITGAISSAQLPASVITNGASGVNITGTFSGDGGGLTNVPGAIPWQTVSGTNQTASANQAYLLTNNALTTLTLPVSANVGDVVTVSGAGANGWQVAANPGQMIVGHSTPAGVNWTAQAGAPSTAWYSVASSADGTKLVAVDNAGTDFHGGQIYTSSDSGVNWTAQASAPSTNWQSVASSADGTKLIAGVADGQIYTSSDSGVTWTAQAGAPSTYWQSVASSADGTKLVAVDYFGFGAGNGGQIYTSSDSGVNWTAQAGAPTTHWQSVASSADGTKLVAVVIGGQIYTSSDSGMNWTAQTNAPSTYWYSVASSADGTKLVAADYFGTDFNGGQIYTSSDSGVNWTAQAGAPTTYWQSVASSADGTKLFAVVSGSPIYTSGDSGTNWTAQTNAPTTSWYSVASSADGTKLVAVVDGGQIYTSDESSPLSGVAGTTAQLQYIGNGVWQPLGESASQIIGTLSPAQLPASVVTNTEMSVILGGTFNGTFLGDGGGLTNVSVNVSQINGTLSTAQIPDLDASKIISGTISAAQLPVSAVTNMETGVTLSGTFTGNGTGLTNVDATTLGGSALIQNTNGLLLGTNLNANSHPILLRGTGDINHGLGYASSVTNFTALNAPDGPVLWGYGGGALGSMGGDARLDLVWTPAGVGIGTNNPVSALQVIGTVTATAFSGDGGGLTNTTTGRNYVYAYNTTTQNAIIANSFLNITFNTLGQMDGWTYNAGSFSCNQMGLYLVQYTVTAQIASGTSQTISMIGSLNSVEIPGSQVTAALISSSQAISMSKSFIVSMTAGDALKLQFAGSSGNVQLVSNLGSGTTRPSASITIIRLQ